MAVGANETGHRGASDAFVTKVAADGASKTYSTYAGGSGDDAAYGVAVNAGGNASSQDHR